jgi:hypothetical protein
MQHVWETGERHTVFWWLNLKERDHLEYLGIVERMILKWTFKMWAGRVWTELVWFRIETAGRLLRISDKPLGSMKCEEFID